MSDIDNPAITPPSGTGLRIQAIGDSRAQQMGLNVGLVSSTYTNLQQSFNDNSAIVWANRILRGRLSFDMTQGYSGAYQGILKVLVLNGGTNYSASPTVTFTGSGTGATATATVVNGVITSYTVTAPGINYSTLPTVTISDASGSGAVAQAVIGGYGTFGVGGETTTQTLARLQTDSTILAAPVDVFLMLDGTNDVTSLIAASVTKNNLETIFNIILSTGKMLIYIPDHARNVWNGISGSQITNARQQLYDVVRWAQSYAKQNAAKNPFAYNRFQIVECLTEMADATSATGDPLTNWTSDGLHFAAISSYVLGYKIAQKLGPLLGINLAAPGNNRITSQADIYNATYNPTGALNANMQLTGTTGALYNPDSNITGNVPTSYWFGRTGSNAGVGTVTLSQESPRTDGYSGSRFVMNYSVGGGTGNVQYCLKIGGNSYLATSAYNINVGDTIVAEFDLELSNQQNLNQCQLSLSFFDASNNLLLVSTSGETQSSGFIWPSATQSMGAVPTIGTNVPLTIQTPQIIVPANTTQFECWLNMGLVQSGAAGSGTAIIKIADYYLHKVT